MDAGLASHTHEPWIRRTISTRENSVMGTVHIAWAVRLLIITLVIVVPYMVWTARSEKES